MSLILYIPYTVLDVKLKTKKKKTKKKTDNVG